VGSAHENEDSAIFGHGDMFEARIDAQITLIEGGGVDVDG